MVVYPAIPFKRIPLQDLEGYLKITMVREPVSRFLSAYSNRVVYYKELSKDHIGPGAEENGVPVNPSLQDFVLHLEIYRKLSEPIRLHTDPLCTFLGRNASFYDRVFGLREMKEFDRTISERVGRTYSTPHLQTGGPKLTESDLLPTESKKIREFYAIDYDRYGRWFQL